MKNHNRKRRFVAKVESMEGRCLLSAVPHFTIKDLGLVSAVGGINSSGQVIGTTNVITPEDPYGIYYANVSGPNGENFHSVAENSFATFGINDSGQFLVIGDGTSIYSQNQPVNLGRGPNNAYLFGEDINNSGNIVGFLSGTNDYASHAFFYDGATHDLGSLGGSVCYAMAINDSNQIVGFSSTGLGQSSPFHAFFYDGSMRDLGTFGGDWSEALGINASGQVVGDSATADGHLHGFISDPNGGALHDLGDTIFWGINDQGQAVGGQKFFDGGHVIDLNTLIPQNQGFSSINAIAINNGDQIAATGTDVAGHTHALLLTPVPQPVAPTITWSNPADIVYGTPLSATQLNATASVPGTFTYSVPEGTVLHAGAAQTLTATFTPNDTADYTTVTATALINVDKRLVFAIPDAKTKVYGAAMPNFTFSWVGFNNTQAFVNGDTSESVGVHPTFAAVISVGDNASASSPAGTYHIANADTPPIWETQDYRFSYGGNTLTITPAPLTVTANNAQVRYGFPIPPLTGTITGLVNGDTDVATYTTTAVRGSWAGYYPIVPHLTDPNYNITFVNGTLTIYWSVPPVG